jgi:hypothetical protein
MMLVSAMEFASRADEFRLTVKREQGDPVALVEFGVTINCRKTGFNRQASNHGEDRAWRNPRPFPADV